MKERIKDFWLLYEKQETIQDKKEVLNKISKLKFRNKDGTFKYLLIDDIIRILDDYKQFKDEVYFY